MAEPQSTPPARPVASGRGLRRSYVLLFQCPDIPGVVAAVSGYLTQSGCTIIESSQFTDVATGRFFMRVVFAGVGEIILAIDQLRSGFDPIGRRLSLQWSLHDLSVRPKILIAVSRFGHCLYDLLHRWRAGLIAADIVGVVSNHEDMRSFVEWSGLPFHHLGDDKPTQERRILEIVDAAAVDLVVLARYMQILSPDLCDALAGRCINIHHSFLPSFKGAKPYHQAHARGVKIIGATAHYVTTDLDEGPIIEQAVERISHAQTPGDLVIVGRDIECTVLARAVIWHIEYRCMLNGRRTVIFR